jgi:hypothetical protein
MLLDEPGRHRLGSSRRVPIAFGGTYDAALDKAIESPGEAVDITQPGLLRPACENCTDLV